MDIPNSLLERLFLYLNWDERARAARVCRRWLSVFYSPILWRKIIFKPPSRRLTKVQYDIKGYRLACCLKAIGSHIQSYHIQKSDDLFLLHRTLILVAKYLEYASTMKPIYDDHSSSSNEEDDNTNVNDKISVQSSDCENKPDKRCESDLENSNFNDSPIFNTDYFDNGDPDAEATLRLVLMLQERELFDLDYDSFSDEDDVFHGLGAGRSFSTSYPATSAPGPHRLSEDLDRYAIDRLCKLKSPPLVLSFELEFHCEVDDLRGFAYGTGGALLSSIKRVMYQLKNLQRLRLTDLFLAPTDARNLIVIISHVTSKTLFDLDLLHLHKPPIDIATTLLQDPTYSFVYPVLTRRQTQSGQVRGSPNHDQRIINSNWYLLDTRWLTARPQRFSHNPLADLANLFPLLKRLTVAPTQLSGAMLLRLLYQTPLLELYFVQTDFTCFTLSRVSLEESFYQDGSLSADPIYTSDEDLSSDQMNSDSSDLIDWTEDIPHWRRFSSTTTHNNTSNYWQPINSDMWQAALILQPNLKVQLKLKLVQYFTLIRWRSQSTVDEQNLISDLSVIENLLACWPQSPAPVESVSLILTGEPKFLADLLNTRNTISVTMYSKYLTSLIIYLEHLPTNLICTNFQYAENTFAQSFDDVLHDIVMACPALKLLALGGAQFYVHILTILMICRQRTNNSNLPNSLFRLLIQTDCCQLESEPVNQIPVNISNWYLSMKAEMHKSTTQIRIAESCISAVLDQPHWHFLSNAEFRDQLYYFLL